MKKIVLTTEQMDKISEYVSTEETTQGEINEGLNDDRYEMKCKIDFNYASDLKFKGQEIEDIGYGLEYTLSFRIDQEHRSWGIKSMSVYDVQGPEELDVEVKYYSSTERDTGSAWGDDTDYGPLLKEEYIKLKVDWDSTDYQNEEPKGMIGIDEDVEMELVNDSEGNIIVKEISVITYSI
ncbi:hypothetical protein N9H34_01535 [bacterium]|nr:hypothetical protein [bacterium]